MLKIQLIRSMHTDLERIHGTTNKCIVGIYGQYTDSELVTFNDVTRKHFYIEVLTILKRLQVTKWWVADLRE